MRHRATRRIYEPFNDPEPIRDQFWLGSLNIKYDLGWAQLVSTTSHWHRFLSQVQDGSEVLQDVLALPGYSVADGGIGNDPWTENDSASQTSEEIRLASSGDSRFQWLAGFFYDDVDSTTVQYSVDQGARAGTRHRDPLPRTRLAELCAERRVRRGLLSDPAECEIHRRPALLRFRQ